MGSPDELRVSAALFHRNFRDGVILTLAGILTAERSMVPKMNCCRESLLGGTRDSRQPTKVRAEPERDTREASQTFTNGARCVFFFDAGQTPLGERVDYFELKDT
jgi:hypothetical protein